MTYQKGQKVRFIRNSRLHLAPKRGRIPDSNKYWETATYAEPTRRGWHRVEVDSGIGFPLPFAVPSRRLRPVEEKKP